MVIEHNYTLMCYIKILLYIVVIIFLREELAILLQIMTALQFVIYKLKGHSVAVFVIVGL